MRSIGRARFVGLLIAVLAPAGIAAPPVFVESGAISYRLDVPGDIATQGQALFEGVFGALMVVF